MNLSCFFTGVLFFIFALMFQEEYPSQPTAIFSNISGILFGAWLITLETKDNPLKIIEEFCRLIVFFFILYPSLNFCINLSVNYSGFLLILFSTLSCIGILLCSFYLIAKFIDIFKFTTNVITQIKQKLFYSVQPTTFKAKILIENITAFLVSIVLRVDLLYFSALMSFNRLFLIACCNCFVVVFRLMITYSPYLQAAYYEIQIYRLVIVTIFTSTFITLIFPQFQNLRMLPIPRMTCRFHPSGEHCFRLLPDTLSHHTHPSQFQCEDYLLSKNPQ